MQLRKNWKVRIHGHSHLRGRRGCNSERIERSFSYGLIPSKRDRTDATQKELKVFVSILSSTFRKSKRCNSERIERHRMARFSISRCTHDATQKELKGVLMSALIISASVSFGCNSERIESTNTDAGTYADPQMDATQKELKVISASSCGLYTPASMMQLRKNWKFPTKKLYLLGYTDPTQKELKETLTVNPQWLFSSRHNSEITMYCY